ncbi:monovalent cation:proton antiporter-2 (CPA2) family protein [Woeseia oceani]|uniref:Glutathione-regulated potassium-efflux system protein KefB n=1 Tax=Woeseia oceani TaxID=1548547 RepID=A0A193LG92_9GAMM|nr:monovalent cation:proton antiporter-2 (CPA2) family protein [Woeseia oceani]ANO51384.1 glutathione-regulated potassium-efflux system protein KefB [Woeseia oceani]
MFAEMIVFLVGAVIAVPLFQRFGLGAVLGYLAAGVIIGPAGMALVADVDRVMHTAELGVVLLLFIVGLELRPARLWTLRRSIFGFGGAQLLLTAVFLGAAGLAAGLSLNAAILVGLVLALSSTAFALQLMAERNELTSRHGRTAFATLLFQDLAVVPLLAIVPLLGQGEGASVGMEGAIRAVVVLLAVVVGGRYLLRYLLRIVAKSGVREALTAAALLIVLGTAEIVELAGLSMALGAFLAGVLLADSEFRHQLEADIEPFKGLLLGLFFISVGMSLNLQLIAQSPQNVVAAVAGLVFLKFAALFLLGRWHGLENAAARRLALILSQGGEFAFVIFGVAVAGEVIETELAEFLIVVVSLSMVTTPLLLRLERALSAAVDVPGEFDTIEDEHNPVIIAGFGRFGQMTARVLRAKRIGFTALDISQEQVDFVARFGNKIYYGDASRLDLLESADAAKAKIFVLAIDDVAASLRTASIVRRHFPHLKIYARARNRPHAYQLMDLGIEVIRRETFLSALDLTVEVLKGLGESDAAARDAVNKFKEHDEQRLHEHRESHNDEQKMQSLAKTAAKELEEMFQRDREDGVRL